MHSEIESQPENKFFAVVHLGMFSVSNLGEGREGGEVGREEGEGECVTSLKFLTARDNSGNRGLKHTAILVNDNCHCSELAGKVCEVKLGGPVVE